MNLFSTLDGIVLTMIITHRSFILIPLRFTETTTMFSQFDEILEKYTTIEENALKGLAFIVVNKRGT
jgi:hypothetical protein